MAAAPPPRVCVVIISYNSSLTLPQCLDSLAGQTFTDFCLLLIDNASDERPRPDLSRFPFPASYVEMEENLGFAQAMNVALGSTVSPLLAALNPDAFPAAEWLAELVAAADQYSDVAAFGSLQISAADHKRIDGFGDHYLVTGQAWRGETLPAADPRQPLDYCFGVCAAAALYRTEVLRRLGGFDGRFFCFYEDVDVCFRLRLAGWQCAAVRSAVVRHVGGASFEGKSELAEFLLARNQWWVFFKNMPLALFAIGAPALIAIQLLAGLKNRRRASLRGLWQGLCGTGGFLTSRQEIQAARKISTRELCRWLTWQPAKFFAKETVITPVNPS